MKKKLIILFILVLTKSLFADEKILDDFISKINKENTWLPVEYLEVIKSVDREKIKQYLPKIGDNKMYVDYLDEYKNWYDESVYEPEKLELEKKENLIKIYIYCIFLFLLLLFRPQNCEKMLPPLSIQQARFFS